MTANKRTVKKYMEGFRQTDRDKILCLADDVEWEIPGLFHSRGRLRSTTTSSIPVMPGIRHQERAPARQNGASTCPFHFVFDLPGLRHRFGNRQGGAQPGEFRLGRSKSGPEGDESRFSLIRKPAPGPYRPCTLLLPQGDQNFRVEGDIRLGTVHKQPAGMSRRPSGRCGCSCSRY